MGKVKQFFLLLAILIFTVSLAACSRGEEKEVYGEIEEVTNSKITIMTGSWEVSENEEDESLITFSNQPGSFIPDGDADSYTLSNNVDIAHLSESAIVKLTIQNDTVTAVETAQLPSAAKVPPEEEDSELDAAVSVEGKESTISDKTYDSSKTNENTMVVKHKGSLTLKNCTLTKSGNTSNDNDSQQYGLNAVFAAFDGGTAAISNTTLTSSGNGANAVFSTGKDSKVVINKFKIFTTGNSSRGLDATFNGVISASNGDISTKGTNCAPITAAYGNGQISVKDTTISSEGSSSPCIYAAGNVIATDVSGNAGKSHIAVAEDSSKITLKDCLLQGSGKSGILFRKNPSSVASSEEKAVLHAVDSKLTTTSSGPMFCVSDTKASVVLKNTTLYYSSGTLAKVSGKDGSALTLKGSNQTLSGNIICEDAGSVSLKLGESSVFEGTFNGKNTAAEASISLSKSSKWKVTGDSYISKFTNKDKKLRNVISNGYTVYYDKTNSGNSWLKGHTFSLPGGGKLTPAA